MAGVSAMVGAGINHAKRTYDVSTNKKNLNASAFGLEWDVNVPYAQLKGEYYTTKGEEDSYNGATAVIVGAAGARELVKSSGYWAQLILKPVDAVWVYGGMGSVKGDDAGNDKVAAASRATTRAKNQQTAAGVIVNFSKAWRLGIEYVMVKTTWLGATNTAAEIANKSNQFAISTQLKF